MMKMLRKKRKGGFTLIELIVVIAILGILALVAIPRFAGVRDDAGLKAAQSYASTVVNAAEIYYVQEGVEVTNTITLTGVVSALESVDLLRGTAFTPEGAWTVTNPADGVWQITIPADAYGTHAESVIGD